MAAIDHSHELEELEATFANSSACRASCHNVINQAIQLAALGHAEEVLSIVQRTPEKALFLPLAEGLRLHLGRMIVSTGAVRSMAIFIAERIRSATVKGFDARTAV